jgi:O-antigen/teichoic acid export membrane protein
MAAAFLAYRLLIAHAGLEALGLWAILIAGGSVARLADASGGTALFRYLAGTDNADSAKRRAAYVETVILTTLTINIALGSTLYLASDPLIRAFLPDAIDQAQLVLPYALVSAFVVTPLAGTIVSGLDGLARAVRRAKIVIASSALMICASVILIPATGVKGFAIAQIIQQGFVVVIGWVFLRRDIAELGLFPAKWSKQIFRETTAFGLKLQAIGLASMLTEPIAKFALMSAGGLAIVGYYELALRLLTQLRSLMVAAFQPLSPQLAAARGDLALLEKLIRRTLPSTRIAGLLFFAGAAMALPAYSLIMLGLVSTTLIQIALPLIAAFAINAYGIVFHNLGTAIGVTIWNFAAQALTCLFVLIGGLGLTSGFGAGYFGVIVSLAAGIGIAAPVTVIGNAHSAGLPSLGRSWLLSCGLSGIGFVGLSVVLEIFLQRHLVAG